MIQDWKPRPKVKRDFYGYVSSNDDPSLLIPDMGIVPTLDAALDQLDNGLSLREVVSHFNEKATSLGYSSLSHAGLKQIWDRERPNHPIRRSSSKPKVRKLTPAEKMEARRKAKIASEKKRIAHARRRIEKASEEIQTIKHNTSPVVEFTGSDGFEAPEEITEEIIFKANEGPQSDFLSASEQEVLFGGAAGGGKSFAMIADPLRYYGNGNFNGLLLRRTNDELRKLVMDSHKLYPKAWPGAKWHEKKSLWTFPSGAQLWLTYLERDEDVLRYQGQDFCWIGVDELTQYATPFAWIYLSSRLRTADKTLPLHMRATTNPGGPGHGWVKRMFVDPAPAGTAFPARDIETGETMVAPHGDPDFPEHMWGKPLFERRFIPSKLTDNPYLDWRYKKNLLSLPEAQRRQLLEGDWNVADGAAFDEFRTSIHVCKPFPLPSEWRRFRSCDYGYSSFSAVHWYAIDNDGTIYVYRELYVTKHTGDALGYRILQEEQGEDVSYGVLDSSVWAVRGQNGPSIAEDIIRTGARFRPADRSKGSRSDGYNRLHELLKVNPSTGKPGIIFFDTCRQIISDLPVMPRHPDGVDDIDDRYASDHAYDSIRYGIMSRPKAFNIFDYPAQGIYGHRPADVTFGY